MAIELAKAYVQIVPSAKGIKNTIKDTLGEESESAGEESGKKIGNGIVKKVSAIVAAAGIGTMIVKGIKASIESGAELEQAVGGIETLFKDSSDTMIQYANNAYKTAGMSATEYMNTATGFAASLLQGLGGDTEAASEIANRAITDMSDNANKMGTDMESIQNAYQGFAKQNYTMLDNLKLGYGGTKSEMQRLIADAAEMTDIQNELGISVDASSMSFDNICNAISVMQESLGIAGTTALEAGTTLSGSANMVKSAWTNVLATLSTGGDIGTAMSGLATSAATFLFDNLIPALGNIVTQIPAALGSFFTTAIPTLLEEGGQLLGAIADGFAGGFPNMMANAPEMVSQFISNLKTAWPTFVENGGKLLSSIAHGFFVKLPEMLDNAPKMINQFSQRLQNKLTTMAQNGGQMLDNIGNGFLSKFPTIVAIIAKLIATMLLALAKILPKLLVFAGQMILKIATGLVTGVPKLLAKIPEIFNRVKESFASKNWSGVGKDIVQGIINGVRNAASQLVSKMKELAKDALNAVKKKLGIHSPSTVMADEVGEQLPSGAAIGVKKKADVLRSAMQDIAQESLGVFPLNLETVGTSGYKDVRRAVNGMDYSSVGEAVANAIVDAGIALKVGDRVAGRIVRKAMA